MKNWFPLLVSMLCASGALAEPPEKSTTATQRQASALVKKKLLDPLKKAQAKRSKFSRAAPPPAQRRVRVLDDEPKTDSRGKRFVRFAVDNRMPWGDRGEWELEAVAGCAYPDASHVYVKQGDGYVPATSLLGKRGKPGKPRTDVCRPATPDPAPGAAPAG